MPGLLHQAALDYAARGWSVIPMQPRAKRPIVAWTVHQHQAATREQIDGWWRHWPEANVGIVTGAISGLLVVDVDRAHGGLASLQALERRHGALPPTPEAATGGGGRHLYFRHPGHPVHNRVGLHPGIDLRGDGGCVVAPPSVHPSGRPYAWLPGLGPGEVDPAALPAWLAGEAAAAPAVHDPTHWRTLVRSGVVEGARNSTLASLSGHLLRHGVDPDVVLELLWAWNRARCRPPLPDDEVAAVVRSITRLHERDKG